MFLADLNQAAVNSMMDKLLRVRAKKQIAADSAPTQLLPEYQKQNLVEKDQINVKLQFDTKDGLELPKTTWLR